MTRNIIQHVKDFRIFIMVHRLGKKTKIIDYCHNLGSVDKTIYEEKNFEIFNYIAKDHKERVQKNRELIAQMEQREVKRVKV